MATANLVVKSVVKESIATEGVVNLSLSATKRFGLRAEKCGVVFHPSACH